jgi:hypothetical protein
VRVKKWPSLYYCEIMHRCSSNDVSEWRMVLPHEQKSLFYTVVCSCWVDLQMKYFFFNFLSPLYVRVGHNWNNFKKPSGMFFILGTSIWLTKGDKIFRRSKFPEWQLPCYINAHVSICYLKICVVRKKCPRVRIRPSTLLQKILWPNLFAALPNVPFDLN